MSKNTEVQNERMELTGFVLIALAFLFFFEAARELIGATYNMNLATMSINSSVAAIFAFFSPIIYLCGLRRVSLHVLVGGGGIVLALSRVGMALNPAAVVYLIFAAVAVVSFGIFFPAVIAQFRAQKSFGSNTLAVLICATIGGAGIDFVFRVLGDTFDIAVYGVTAYRLTALLVVLPSVLGFLAALVWWYRANINVSAGQNNGEPKKGFRALFGFSLGAVGLLHSLFLGYPNIIARWVDGSYSLAAVLMGAALGGVLLLAAVKKLHWLISDRGLIVGSSVIILAFIVLVYFPVPVLSIVLGFLALAFLPVLLGNALAYLLQPGITVKQIAAFMTVAAGVLVLFLFLSVFSLTWAFVPGVGFLRDQMGTIAMVIVLLALLGTAAIRYSTSGKLFTGSSIASIAHPHVLAVLGVVIIVVTASGVFIYQSHPAEAGERLIVMTYNIHQGYNTEGKINPWELLEPIRSANPHIIALQESDMNRISSTNVDIVQWLAHKLDMYVYFGPETKHQIYGVAILSKYPITFTETYYLTSIEDQRVLVRADIQFEGRPLSIYAVHMGLSEEDRTTQAAEIVDIVSENTNCIILMGDLNSIPGSPQIAAFTAVLRDAWTSAGNAPMDPLGYTSDSLDPQKRIDYILVSPELASRVTHCQVIRGAHGSDHLPVWAEIV